MKREKQFRIHENFGRGHNHLIFRTVLSNPAKSRLKIKSQYPAQISHYLTFRPSAFRVFQVVPSRSSVNDTIPDAWRALYFGGDGTTTNSQSCATCDADNDGVNNLQEFLAGTNPTNATSALKLVAMNPNPSNTVANFLSATGAVYQVQSRDDLSTGVWSITMDQISGNGTNIFILNPNAPSSKRFFRLQLLW